MLDLRNCNICPRKCGIDRTAKVGYCGAGENIEVAKIMHHHWEEPPISGTPTDKRASGTVFFSHCPLGCVYCQNSKISRRNSSGKAMSPVDLAREMLILDEEGMYNVNLVSPTHYTPQIIEAVRIAKSGELGKKLTIPVVWNTGGYELPETVELLSETVDVFLTDFKYSSKEVAKKYSAAENYPEYALSSLLKMLDITGGCVFDENGIMKKGVIVRHLVLPSHRDDSIAVLRKIAANADITKLKLSLMAQYTPDFLPPIDENDGYAKIRRKITTYEYEKVANEAYRLGFDGYMQDRSSATKNFTPDF